LQVLLTIDVTLVQLEHKPIVAALVCHEHELVGQLYMSANETPKKLSTIAA
jgi:hypothetical protein